MISERGVDMSEFYNGIDVSKYQGIIDWNKVKNSQQFAFIRVGWAGYDGRVELDEKFHNNMRSANLSGIDVGVYLYSYCQTTNAAVAAAKQILELVSPYKLTYPVAFDVEDNMYTKKSKVENSVIATAFLNEIEKNQYYAMLYTYTNFAQNYLDMSMLGKFDLWIADYREQLGYDGNYGIWQYTSRGAVDGISTNVDKNYCVKDYPSIIRVAGLNKLTPIVLPQTRYGVKVTGFTSLVEAATVGKGLGLLNLYNEIYQEEGSFTVEVFSFSKRERAVSIAQSIKIITDRITDVVEKQ